VAVLSDDDFAGGDEAAGGCAGGFHEALPCSSRFEAADLFGGFGGADGLGLSVLATRRSAFGEEREDGGFEGCIEGAGFVAAAGVAAIFDDVPVLRPLLAPLEGASAGLADLVLVRGDAFGFTFAVGHGTELLNKFEL